MTAASTPASAANPPIEDELHQAARTTAAKQTVNNLRTGLLLRWRVVARGVYRVWGVRLLRMNASKPAISVALREPLGLLPGERVHPPIVFQHRVGQKDEQLHGRGPSR